MKATFSFSQATLGFAVLLAVGSTGCASIWKPQEPNLDAKLIKPATASAAAAPQAGGQQAKFMVDVVPSSGRTQSFERAISGPTHVQEVVDQSGALKRFRRLDLSLVRTLPHGGLHRLPVEYDKNVRKVSPASDYTLMPGDRLIIKEDSTTIIDDMLKSALGPIGEKVLKGSKGSPTANYQISG